MIAALACRCAPVDSQFADSQGARDTHAKGKVRFMGHGLVRQPNAQQRNSAGRRIASVQVRVAMALRQRRHSSALPMLNRHLSPIRLRAARTATRPATTDVLPVRPEPAATHIRYGIKEKTLS
jgi:hypothetical protein